MNNVDFSDPIMFQEQGAGTVDRYGVKAPAWNDLFWDFAEVVDTLQLRSVRDVGDIRLDNDSVRIRIRWRPNMHSGMRIKELSGAGRILQIISGPVEIYNRNYLEIIAENYTS